MYAAREGRVAVCEKLLEHGAEINKQDIRGWTVSFLLAIFLFQLKLQLLCCVGSYPDRYLRQLSSRIPLVTVLKYIWGQRPHSARGFQGHVPQEK